MKTENTTKRPIVLLALALFMGLSVAGLANSTGSEQDDPLEQSTPVIEAVAIGWLVDSWDPVELSTSEGSVLFENPMSMDHRPVLLPYTGGDGLDVPGCFEPVDGTDRLIAPGESVVLDISDCPPRIEYECGVHPGLLMRGTILREVLPP